MPITTTTSRTNRYATAAVVLLLLLLSAQVLHAIHGQSLTWDEDDHIFAGYESWKTHDFGLNPEHPPLVKLLATLPLLPLHLTVPPLQHRFFKAEAYFGGRQFLFHNGPADGNQYSAETLVFRARLPTLLFTLAAALLVFFAAREMFSLRAGLLALTLFCFEPNLLAHGAYVTTDMAAACTFFATIYCLYRYLERPTFARLLVTGVAAGLALASKHSTVLLAPMLVLLLAGELLARAISSRRPRDPRQTTLPRTALHYVFALAIITLIGVLVLWSSTDPATPPAPPHSPSAPASPTTLALSPASKPAASSSPPTSTSSPKATSTASPTSARWPTTCPASSSVMSTATASGTTSP